MVFKEIEAFCGPYRVHKVDPIKRGGEVVGWSGRLRHRGFPLGEVEDRGDGRGAQATVWEAAAGGQFVLARPDSGPMRSIAPEFVLAPTAQEAQRRLAEDANLFDVTEAAQRFSLHGGLDRYKSNEAAIRQVMATSAHHQAGGRPEEAPLAPLADLMPSFDAPLLPAPRGALKAAKEAKAEADAAALEAQAAPLVPAPLASPRRALQAPEPPAPAPTPGEPAPAPAAQPPQPDCSAPTQASRSRRAAGPAR